MSPHTARLPWLQDCPLPHQVSHPHHHVHGQPFRSPRHVCAGCAAVSCGPTLPAEADICSAFYACCGCHVYQGWWLLQALQQYWPLCVPAHRPSDYHPGHKWPRLVPARQEAGVANRQVSPAATRPTVLTGWCRRHPGCKVAGRQVFQLAASGILTAY